MGLLARVDGLQPSADWGWVWLCHVLGGRGHLGGGVCEQPVLSGGGRAEAGCREQRRPCAYTAGRPFVPRGVSQRAVSWDRC